MTTLLARLRTLLLSTLVLATLFAVGSPAAHAAAPFPPPPIGPTGYVTMSDGVQIAINVRMPIGFAPGQKVPTIFEMSGYDGASENDQTYVGYLNDFTPDPIPDVPVLPAEGSRQLTKWFYAHYATVHASVRGTGCSGGEFDLFSWRSALDGREVIEWIAGQNWSNGKVGIMGHSYSGITGFMVGATRPPHLVAMTVSGLIDDLYRGISYPGGVSNFGFPLLWTLGIRPAYDILGGQLQPILTNDKAKACGKNIASHTRTIINDPVVQGVFGDTDNSWYQARSLINYAHLINVPIHITGAYQDEQTSARGPSHLWEAVKGVPKRLVLTNGDHGTNQSGWIMTHERVPWMDHWMRGVDNGYGALADNKTSATTLFDFHNGAPVERLDGTNYPLPDTTYLDWYLRKDHKLKASPPAAGEGPLSYVSGTKRQAWSYEAGYNFGPPVTTADGPDELTFASENLTKDMVVDGPITADLFMSVVGVDAEIFVQLIDQAPDGSRSYLQRGLLKASHRAYDPNLSDWFTATNGVRTLYRPYRPHTNPTNLTPNQIYEFLVEIWPVGHIFRTGHQIMVKIMAPPASDSLNAYLPRTTPTYNTVYFDPAHPSHLSLPMVHLTVPIGPALACGEQEAVRCVRSPN